MKNTDLLLAAYFIYLPVVILLTLYVSKTLFKNGKLFMLDIFRGKETIALATNKLFEVGFYLLNLGFALLIIEINGRFLINYTDLLEVLSRKVGGFSIYLGIMLFFNLFLFFRGRKMSKQNIVEKENFATEGIKTQ